MIQQFPMQQRDGTGAQARTGTHSQTNVVSPIPTHEPYFQIGVVGLVFGGSIGGWLGWRFESALMGALIGFFLLFGLLGFGRWMAAKLYQWSRRM